MSYNIFVHIDSIRSLSLEGFDAFARQHFNLDVQPHPNAELTRAYGELAFRVALVQQEKSLLPAEGCYLSTVEYYLNSYEYEKTLRDARKAQLAEAEEKKQKLPPQMHAQVDEQAQVVYLFDEKTDAKLKKCLQMMMFEIGGDDPFSARLAFALAAFLAERGGGVLYDYESGEACIESFAEHMRLKASEVEKEYIDFNRARPKEFDSF